MAKKTRLKNSYAFSHNKTFPFGLTDADEAFCREYLKNLNASLAYRTVHPRVSAGSARSCGSELLAKPDIQNRLKQLIDIRNTKCGVTGEMVVDELKCLAFHDARKSAKWTSRSVTLKSSDKIDDETARAISEIAETENGLKVKFHSKDRALDLLGKHLGLWDKGSAGAGTNVQMIVNVQGNKTAKLIAEVVEHGAER
jgi:phage terminase small subunit